MPSHNPFHLPGHRIHSVCYARREVVCQCGAVLTVEDDESREIRNEALALAFHEHRRAVAKARGYDWLHVQ